MSERRLKHFGWGREGEGLTPEEEGFALERYRRLFAVDRFDERSPPAVSWLFEMLAAELLERLHVTAPERRTQRLLV